MNCPKCKEKLRVIPAGVSKRTGRAYQEFSVCDACDYKETPKAAKDPIKAAQERKGQSISEAQTRNEVMWAKKSAMDFLTFHPMFKNLKEDEWKKKFSEIANNIINESLLPF